MKYIRRKRCGKICLAPLFFCGMYCILHPFQKCQWKVRIDIGIFIGNAIFQKLWNPSWCWLASIVEWYINMQMHIYIYLYYMFIYDIIQHIPRMAFWCAKCSSPNPWFFLRRFFQRTAMDAPVLTLPLPREAVLQGYQVQDRPVTMRDQTAADCRSYALGFNCNIPRIDSKQNILTGFFVEFWNLIKVHSLESGCQRPWPQQLEMHRTWKVW